MIRISRSYLINIATYHGDETLSGLVVDPEGVLELPLHCLDVRVLNQELETQYIRHG